MKRHSCSESLIFVTDKLSLTWNHVENKQRGKGHVNNSFPQNQASHFCYRIFFPLLLALITKSYFVRYIYFCVGLDVQLEHRAEMSPAYVQLLGIPQLPCPMVPPTETQDGNIFFAEQVTLFWLDGGIQEGTDFSSDLLGLL